MKISRTILGGLLLALTVPSQAQVWADAYGEGLSAVRNQRWSEAREAFRRAIANRPDDFAQGTRLPGPVTERRFWRNGAPYSPNFGAAYAGFKLAGTLTEDGTRTTLLREVVAEFEALLAKDQASRETFFFLGQAYSALRDVARQRALEGRVGAAAGRFVWRVDPEILAAEDRAAMDQAMGAAAPGTTPNGGTTVRPTQAGALAPTGPVAKDERKFALLIGNAEGQIEALKVPFAASDATLLREKLVEHAGYSESNVVVATNASSAEMRTTAQALAERVPNGATVFIFYSGVGAHLDGKDFFAGIDTTGPTDSANMFAKSELYQMFMRKGCRIFAFFQVHRPMTGGVYFGLEQPMVGAIAQTQAVIPNGTVRSIVSNGQTVGLFTDAIAGVLGEFRSSAIPINEFGWRVFNWMRGGRNGESGTGSAQIMTLPQVVNMREDERF